MSKFMAGLWIFTTALFTVTSLIAFMSPDWFTNEQLLSSNNISLTANVSFGLLRYCTVADYHSSLTLCKFYRGITSIPSTMWILCSVVYIAGAFLMAATVFTAIFGCCCSYERWNRLRIGMLYAQIFGIAFLLLSLIFYPIGLNSSFAKSVCGYKSNIYSPHQCNPGWGYVLGIMSVLLMLFLPIFAKYSSLGPRGYQKTDSTVEVLQLSPGGTTKRMTTV